MVAVPEVGEGKRGLDGHLGYLLRQAANALRLAMERALADLDVTPPQFTVLTMLAAYPGCSSADLARLCLLTPPTITVIIGNLEKRSLISRHAHASHGRIRQIEVTPAGHELLAACRQRVHATEARLVDDFSDGEQAGVRRWLSTIAKTLSQDA
ncbi:MAG: MarR family transcriptional regulator [Thermomonas sp.]|uniref:MarR family winged helix-turn-helix transcriptional regulator n=1 Tax=Thermomonas sp. TaxID=1971895 RepID=UPI0039E6419C